MGAGQFCTNPGFVVVVDGPETQKFISSVTEKMSAAAAGTLLTRGVQSSLVDGIKQVVAAGAELLTGGKAVDGPRVAVENTVLKIGGDAFLANPTTFQTEMFGAATLFVVAKDIGQVPQIIGHLEGNLTGSIYWSKTGTDDTAIGTVTAALRPKVGRLLHDKMPTGVAVSPAMNHGGPFPATGHPHFTSVGIPASLRRFGTLECYDAVRETQLPPSLRNKNPTGKMWRLVDGNWTQGDV
jgi:NADP-dependent aldehyde dehydrogenase